jgi:hypothetical protein
MTLLDLPRMTLKSFDCQTPLEYRSSDGLMKTIFMSSTFHAVLGYPGDYRAVILMDSMP